MKRTSTLDRRTFVRAGTLAAVGSVLAGCTSGSDGDGGSGGGDGGGSGGSGGSDGGDGGSPTGGGGGGQSFGGWLDDTGNYDRVVDETGSGEVTVEVGAQGNGGAFAFAPAAVRVDAGTTVVWEWTGEGVPHNVVAKNGDFGSDMASEAGHTFERTFEESGTYKYLCEPHEQMGMKGVVVVE